jgi:hypothetical protein
METDIMTAKTFSAGCRARPGPWSRRSVLRGFGFCCAALLCLLLAGCSGGGIYGSVGIAGPSVDLGPVSVNTGVHLGRWL